MTPCQLNQLSTLMNYGHSTKNKERGTNKLINLNFLIPNGDSRNVANIGGEQIPTFDSSN